MKLEKYITYPCNTDFEFEIYKTVSYAYPSGKVSYPTGVNLIIDGKETELGFWNLTELWSFTWRLWLKAIKTAFGKRPESNRDN